MSEKKITDKKMASVLFLLCWMAYFTCYIGRLNYSSAMTAMIGEAVLDRTQAGFISMVYFFAYGGGQLLNGFLGDRLHPGRMIFAGLTASMVCNIIMGSITSFSVMAVIWGINGYAQAMIWPPIIRIFAQMLEEKTKLKYCVDIVSTQALGTLASYLLSAGMLSAAGWRMVFWAAAGCLGFTAAVWLGGFTKVERYVRIHGKETEDGQKNTGKAGEAQKSFLSLLLSSGLLLIVAPVMVHGILKDGVTSWVPTFIHETFHTSPSLSILVTTVLPIVNLTGAYAARYVYRRCGEREGRAASLFFLLSVAALILLQGLGGVSLLLTVVLLAVITSSMMAVNTLFVNLLPLRFAKYGRVSSVSGFLNAMAYAGTAVSTFTIGVTVERLGWNAAIVSWVIITAAGTLICLAAGKKSFGG